MTPIDLSLTDFEARQVFSILRGQILNTEREALGLDAHQQAAIARAADKLEAALTTAHSGKGDTQ